MFDRLLPRNIDNSYRGRRLALWLFALVALMVLGLALSLWNREDSRSEGRMNS